ncbi:MAG: ABC transporter substrate-binding protein [Deltaproteobacteria bacterium]|nr:ABC transporter substrate-binding protein [Deltaproteobacteria bacterium]
MGARLLVPAAIGETMFIVAVILAIVIAWPLGSVALAASAPTRVTIHVPSQSLSIMPYYFGKDKGFFAAEQIEPQLVIMAPPTAIAALIAGELDFSSTTGAATSAIMRGVPLRRVFYVQQDPVHVLLAQPEIKSVEALVGKAVGVTALTDAVGMSTSVILRAHGIEPGKVTLLAMQVTDTAIKSLTSKKIAATLLAPPYVEELEAKGYVKLAEARTYAPLSFIGLISSLEAMKKSPQKVQGMITALHRTMNYILNPANRSEVVQYVSTYHKIDLPLAEKAFAAQLLGYSKDGTKPRTAVEKEIEIYRETLKIAKSFTPDDLEDLSLLRKVQGK